MSVFDWASWRLNANPVVGPRWEENSETFLDPRSGRRAEEERAVARSWAWE